MAELTPEIETMENRYMRAWAQGELSVLKSLTARRFNLLIGAVFVVLLLLVHIAGKRWEREGRLKF